MIARLLLLVALAATTVVKADDAMSHMAATAACQRSVTALADRDPVWQWLPMDEVATWCAEAAQPLSAWRCAEKRIDLGDNAKDAGQACGFNPPPGDLATLTGDLPPGN